MRKTIAVAFVSKIIDRLKLHDTNMYLGIFNLTYRQVLLQDSARVPL